MFGMAITGLAVDQAGDVYVSDLENRRIQKFTGDGAYLTQWGTLGTGNGQFEGPWGIAVDAAGNVYVADLANQRVQKFSADGTYLTKWDKPGSFPMEVAVDDAGDVYVVYHGSLVQKFTAEGACLSQWGGEGDGDGRFRGAYGITLEGAGTVYVGESVRIEKFARKL